MTAILCRLAQGNTPAVFIADTLKGDTIQQWDGAKGTKPVPVAFYQTTEPVSDADAEHMRQAYMKATGQAPETVFVRQRLPRVFRERASVLGGEATATPPEKRSRKELAREQYEREKAATGQPVPGAVPITINVPPEHADALRMLEDPRTAALILKIAETLRVAL